MPSGEARGPPPALIAVIAATLAVRLVVGSLTPLTEDEAYYRLWSMAPAFGYYDHPPMIAWWIWLGRQMAGDTPLGARLLPILAGAVTSLIVFDLARLAGADRRAAGRAGVWFNAMLLVLAGGFLAVPDAPASLFWAATLWCALRASRGDELAWWAGAGAAAGLACLSKYSALFIAPGMLIWLAVSPGGRARLRTAGPWLAAAVAAAIVSANLAWNADHHWLTFDKQFGRVAAHRFAPLYLAELIAGQALLLNPLIALFAAAAIMVRRRPDRPGADLTAFFALAAPFAAYLVVHSLHDRVQAHWPAPLYPLLAVCAAEGAARLEGRAPWRGLAHAAPWLGFALGAVALGLLATPGGVLGPYDLALPVRGWGPFTARLEALRRAAGAAWVGTASYGLAAQLADQSALRAPVVQLAERDRWNGLAVPAAPDLRRPGLAVDLTRRMSAASLGRCFATVTPLGVISRGDPGEAGKPYAVFLLAAPRRDVLANGC
ncbi:MAG TPA: glycosyltransferase family 39 protein [Caulobacteraceae bacterium]|nr:glycosyltransferase family 39 protein [Caulobacteraceae bacterium]